MLRADSPRGARTGNGSSVEISGANSALPNPLGGVRGLPIVAAGLRRFAWLNTLKKSARNCKRPDSPSQGMANDLATDQSNWIAPGPPRLLRPSAPTV